MTCAASVIVPTFGDWTGLQACLDCLARQTAKPDVFEIIVANNNPTADLPSDLRLPANAKVVWEPKPGSYAARNAATARARGDILFFTDADCLPEPDWIAAGLAAFAARPGIGRIGGAVIIEPAGETWTIPERYDKIFWLRQERHVSFGYAATANLIVRRALFEKVGPFNDGLYSGGDKEWNKRAAALGEAIIHEPAVAVRHPARADFAELAKKRIRVAGGRHLSKPRKSYRAVLSTIGLLFPSPGALRRILREGGFGPGVAMRIWWLDYRLRLATFRAVTMMRFGGRDANRQ